MADGKFYAYETVPPEIPYQRALLLFDGERQTLIVQSKYRTSQGSAGNLGWVVPVPAVPELASMDPELADAWFQELDRASSPVVTRVSHTVQAGFLLLVCGGAVLTLLACLLSLRVPLPGYVARHRPALAIASLLVLLPVLTLLVSAGASRLVEGAGLALFCCSPVLAALILQASLLAPFGDRLRFLSEDRLLLIAASLASLAISALLLRDTLLTAARRDGLRMQPVEIIEAQQVGIYGVQVVTAGQAGDLIEWLAEGGLYFDAADQKVCDD